MIRGGYSPGKSSTKDLSGLSEKVSIPRVTCAVPPAAFAWSPMAFARDDFPEPMIPSNARISGAVPNLSIE